MLPVETWQNSPRCLCICESLLIDFVEDVEILVFGVVVHGYERERINGKTKVQPVIEAVKECHVGITHLYVLDVVKYSAARARDLTEVFMPIQRLVFVP